MKVTILNISTENFGGEQDVVDVSFRLGNDEIYHAYLDVDGEIDLDSLDVGGWDANTVAHALQSILKDECKKIEIQKVISDSVFGSNDFKESEMLFGTWLNSWGVFKFNGSDGECGVAVCHANDDSLRIDRKAKTFASEEDFKVWRDAMYQDDHCGDANVVNRAINDIHGNFNI